MKIEIRDLTSIGHLEVEDLSVCPAEIVVVQDIGIPGSKGDPGDLSSTTIVPPLSYDAGTYTLQLAAGSAVGQILKWNGSNWIASNPPPRRVEYRTITAGEEAAKALTLAHSVTEPSEFLFDIKNGGGSQFPDVDFRLEENSVAWGGLSLDGVLAEGDQVRLIYQ